MLYMTILPYKSMNVLTDFGKSSACYNGTGLQNSVVSSKISY